MIHRYCVDTKDMAPETEVTLYRELLRWGAKRGDRFELGFEPEVYEASEDVEGLRTLGDSATFSSGDGTFLIQGRISDRFIEEMTAKAAPAGALSGDICPVDFVTVYLGDRAIYVSYDYGTVQTMDLTDDELETLQSHLMSLGITAKFCPM